MSDSCIFCKIARREVPSAIVYQDGEVTAFRDIHPVAPTHILIIPNKHIVSLNELESGDRALVGQMILTARQIAAQEGIHQDGYRLIWNTGPNGGQTVGHMHLHLIGGQRMRHPMG